MCGDSGGRQELAPNGRLTVKKLQIIFDEKLNF
jgi:hypothetical protein